MCHTLEIRGDSLTVVHWVNATSRSCVRHSCKTERAQKEFWQWREDGWVHTVDRTEGLSERISRKHTWVDRGADGRTERWVTKRKWEWKNIKSVTGVLGTSANDKDSDCGVMIKVVDSEVCFTIGKIALQLDNCSARQAEIKGSELLLGALNENKERGNIGLVTWRRR